MNDGCDSEPDNRREEIVRLITCEQTSLFRYIATLLGDVNDASNVLQQTNMVLWRKADDFKFGTSFQAWARRVAYYQTLAYIRDLQRDRLVFDEDVIRHLATQPSSDDDDERRVALRHCLGELSENSLDLLRLRYSRGNSIREIAAQCKINEGAVKMALVRTRRALVQCIENQLHGVEG